MTTRAFFKVCLVLILLNTIVEKHTLNPEIALLYQFHAQKALFKVPKICNINFWIENCPSTPLELSRKFIRFGAATLPLELPGKQSKLFFRTPYRYLPASPRTLQKSCLLSEIT